MMKDFKFQLVNTNSLLSLIMNQINKIQENLLQIVVKLLLDGIKIIQAMQKVVTELQKKVEIQIWFLKVQIRLALFNLKKHKLNLVQKVQKVLKFMHKAKIISMIYSMILILKMILSLCKKKQKKLNRIKILKKIT